MNNYQLALQASMMQVHHQIELLPPIRNAVITIGTFDGVHTGHQQILKQLKEEAAKVQGETVIITFHPHPRKVIQSQQPPVPLINTMEEKIELLDANAIDHLVIVPFTESFSQLTPEQYIEDFLVKMFHPHTIIIGYDHCFGQGRKGNYQLLEKYAAAGNFVLKEIPGHIRNESAVSSTRIREDVMKGNIEEANALLGYDFFFEGVVIEGNKLGRTLGYPTANLKIENEEKLVPGNGVYAVEVEFPVAGNHFKSMMNIGVRPTVDGTKRVIEVNIFDFDEDIYGKILRIRVKKFLRSELKFAGLDALKEQLKKDKEAALLFLG